MHLLFGLLRMNGLYTFRALLAHPQEALYKPEAVRSGFELVTDFLEMIQVCLKLAVLWVPVLCAALSGLIK
jgi:hypothetical protein